MKSNYLVVVLFISVMYVISGSAFAAPLEAARVLPQDAAPGQAIDVTINIKVDEAARPESYIIYETVPAGFEVIDKGGMSYDASKRQLKLMVVESEYYGTKVESLTLTYKVKSATPQDSAFSGYVRYDNQNQDIAGDSKITFATAGSGCMPSWVLDDAWSECVGNVQYKAYHDSNNCGLAPPESASQPCASTPPAPQEATAASSPDATNNADNAIIVPPSSNNAPAPSDSQAGQAVLAQQTYSGYGDSCNTGSCESSLSCKRDLRSSNSICCKPNECAANGACPPEYSCSSTPKKLCYNGGWIDVLNYEVNCVDSIDNDCDGKIDTQDSDCPPVCGNKICETGEDKTSCPGDCGGDRYIIIRSDDIAPLWSTDNSIYLTEYIRSMSIPQTLGVIPLSDQGTIKLEDDSKLVSYLVSIKNDPLIEIGLHGLDHSIDEFQGIGQTVSFSKINDGKNVMKNAISVDPTTFLPPYFSYDEDTLYGARNAGIKIFSAGWNAVDMGHAFREYPAGLFNIPATTDIYNWGTEVLYSAEEIESSCENAITRFGTCVIVIHHHSFVDEGNNIDPDKIAVLTDVLQWIKSQEAKGVKLRTLGVSEKDAGGISDNIAPPVIIDSPLNITYDVKTVLFSAHSNETVKEMRESIDSGAPTTVCTQCMSFAHISH